MDDPLTPTEARNSAEEVELPPLPLSDQQHFRNEKRRTDKARKADGETIVTCPASRHAQIIAEHVGARKPYPMLQEEPEHCAMSILSAVGSLYEARLQVERLSKELAAIRGIANPLSATGPR